MAALMRLSRQHPLYVMPYVVMPPSECPDAPMRFASIPPSCLPSLSSLSTSVMTNDASAGWFLVSPMARPKLAPPGAFLFDSG
jgi:hypothetical protein